MIIAKLQVKFHTKNRAKRLKSVLRPTAAHSIIYNLDVSRVPGGPEGQKEFKERMDMRPIGVFDSGLGGLTAVRELQRRGEQVSLCHFNFIHPLPRGVREIFSRFRRIVVCELNSGQFAGYLRQQFQEFEFLQYNKIQGLPFTVTELGDEFARLLKS